MKKIFLLINICLLTICLCSCSKMNTLGKIVIYKNQDLIFGFIANTLAKTVTNKNEYEKYYGVNGKYKYLYLGYNDIFPDTIKDVLNVKKMIFKEYWLIDSSFISYLVIEYDDSHYTLEKKRLKNLDSSDDYHIYGITGFEKELCAIYADRFGIIYALSDDKAHEISYVNIQFCDCFIDMDYRLIIKPEDLPIGFNALINNPTEQQQDAEFEEYTNKHNNGTCN